MSGKTGKFVAYYRVSTDRQGDSGLGLDAQKHRVRDYLGDNGHELVAEYSEVESGTSEDRPKLDKAIQACEAYGATLIVAKLDRLARNASLLYKLRDAGVETRFANMPEANGLTVSILAAVAEHEARQISERTKAALAELKAQGQELGTPENLTDADRQKGAERSAEVRAEKASRHALALAPTIRQLQDDGHTSLRALAGQLQAKGLPTTRGGDNTTWTATAVSRVLDRIEKLEA